MSARGMGSAVGQVPEYIEMVTRWCKQNSDLPVIVKLTPNITDIRYPARAAYAGGADAVSLINTVSSITSVNLDTMARRGRVHQSGRGQRAGLHGRHDLWLQDHRRDDAWPVKLDGREGLWVG
jgi:dihydropyrimidine dehydrogenase (NAD+) subunit PreA